MSNLDGMPKFFMLCLLLKLSQGKKVEIHFFKIKPTILSNKHYVKTSGGGSSSTPFLTSWTKFEAILLKDAGADMLQEMMLVS